MAALPAYFGQARRATAGPYDQGIGGAGQTVSLAQLQKAERRWSVGDRVAVSGLHRPGGAIVASLVEKRGSRLEQVAGPIEIAADGTPTVGHLKLNGVDTGLVGQRAVLRGSLAKGAFNVTHGESGRALFGSQVRKLSIEALCRAERQRASSWIRPAG